MTQRVFKLCGQAEWEAAKRAGRYHGSAHDMRDGFIHLSTAKQVPGTAAKYFAGRRDLLLIEFDTSSFGSALRFEASRSGELFPHLHGTLDPDRALRVLPLPWTGERHGFAPLLD